MISLHTNMASMLVKSNLKSASGGLKQALERMTTGYKINQAKDNAAGYSIANTMKAKIGSYEVAEDNISIGIDLLSTAGDIIGTMQDHAIRLRALAIQARNGTYSAESLAAINAEAEALTAEINRLYNTAEYNGVGLFTGGTATETTPGAATFAMRRSAEPEVATFAMTRATTSSSGNGRFIEAIEKRDTSSMVTITQLVNGTTSATNEYSISTKDELVALANYVNSGKNTSGMTFVLGADIDLSSISNWTPIGDYSTNSNYQFRGIFDGNGHVIKNLTINNETKEFQGLFGVTASGSEIKNLGLKGGSVKGSGYVGGLVGTSNSSINNCYATVDVTGSTVHVGGLVGSARSSISNCYATGAVSGGTSVGGLIGASTSSSSISNSYATGTASGNVSIGGLVGSSGSNISNCYATGDVIANTQYAGGLVGYATSVINNSSSTGDVTGNGFTGGLVGVADTSITNSYATGDVSGEDTVGGLVGIMHSTHSLSNSYATGTVEGTNKVGGLVGQTSSDIVNCYATGDVAGSTGYVGGLAGYYKNSSSLIDGATIQPDSKATLMTKEEIKATYTPESMGFTEANGWTIVNGVPLQSWQKEVRQASSGKFSLQIGINGDSSSRIEFNTGFICDLTAIEGNIASNGALARIDDFLNLLSEKQTKLGAVQNRLESALESNTANIKSLTSSLSTIRDADIAEESSSYIQHQILQNACATLLATANQTPSIALSLI